MVYVVTTRTRWRPGRCNPARWPAGCGSWRGPDAGRPGHHQGHAAGAARGVARSSRSGRRSRDTRNAAAGAAMRSRRQDRSTPSPFRDRAAVISPLLHRPPDLRLGDVDRHRPRRAGRRRATAGRPVPGDRPADRPGVVPSTPGPTPRWSPTPSPRRSSSRSTASRTCCTCPAQCTNDGGVQPDRHVRAGHRPEHGPGARPEPRQPGHAAAARRGQADRA